MQLRWEQQIKNILIREKEILLSVLVDDMITGKKSKNLQTPGIKKGLQQGDWTQSQIVFPSTSNE